MKVKNMGEFRENWIKKHPIGKKLSLESQKESSYIINDFFSIVHGDSENLKSAIRDIIGDEPLEQIIYELIQNAYDENGDTLLVYYDDEYILFVNNGEPFNKNDIRAICNRGQSTKSSDFRTDQIGQFGKGFKASYYLLGGGDIPSAKKGKYKKKTVYEILENFEGHTIFSWNSQEHMESFLDFLENHSLEEIKIKSWESKEDIPVLFKLILTAVPVGLHEKLKFSDSNEDYREFFTIDEINKLSGFINKIDENYNTEYRLKLKDMLKSEKFQGGSLFFIKLNQKSKLDDICKNQEYGIKNSLIFLKNDSKEFKNIVINGNYYERPNDIEVFSNMDGKISIAYACYGNMKKHPNLYRVFPITSEVYNLNFIINADFKLGDDRDKLSWNDEEDVNYNEKIFEDSVKIIINEIENRKEIIKDFKNKPINTKILKSQRGRKFFEKRLQKKLENYEELAYAILSSNKPNDKRIHKLIYMPLIEYVYNNILCRDNNNIIFESNEKVVIKNTKLDITPKDFGIDKYWFYVVNKRTENVIHDKHKRFLKTYSIVDLLNDKKANFDKVNKWIENLLNGKKLDCKTYFVFLKELIENWDDSEEFLDRIKKLKFILTESGNFTCLDDGAYFPIANSENLKIERFNFVNKKLLEDAKIKRFFEEKLEIKELNEKIIILKGILPKYENKNPKISYGENIDDLGYIKENLYKLKEHEKNEVLDKIKESYIIRVKDRYGNIKFSKPINAYIPKEYSDDDTLEVYFTNHPANFVVEDYLPANNKIERNSWFRFLKNLECNDKPILKYIIWTCRISNDYENEFDDILYDETENKNYNIIEYDKKEEMEKIIEMRLKKEDLYGRRCSYHYYILCDWEIDGLENALSNIKNERNAFEISKSTWKFLKEILLKNNNLKGKYNWFYYSNNCYSFESYIYKLLRKNEWLPDENGNFRNPNELFVPSEHNKNLLINSVNYLHPDFEIDMSSYFVENIGIKIDVTIEDILDYLKNLSNSDKEMDINNIISIYRLLYSETLRNGSILYDIKSAFSKYPLVYISSSKKWKKISEVFWEDENIVFGDTREYLINYYANDNKLKDFFKDIGIKEKADIPDYINAIKDTCKNEKEVNKKIKTIVQKLYEKIWSELERDTEILWKEYESELNELKNGRYWLGNKNGEYGFYYVNEIFINDHSHYYELFKDKIPFWEFKKRFTEEFGIKRMLDNIGISIICGETEKELKEWTNKLDEITPEIIKFIKFILSKKDKDDELENILKKLTKIKIWKTNKITAEYTLKNEIAEDNVESYLDVENGILYVSSDDNYELPHLIGNAYEMYSSKYELVKLREFIKDLLNTNEVDKVITRWNREEGIDFNIDVEKYLILSKITPKVGVNTPSKTAPSEIGDSSGNKQRYPPSDMNTNPIEETIPEKKIDKNTSPIREITYIEPKQEHGCGKQHNSPSQRKKDTDLEQKFEEILKELGYNEGEDYIKQYGLLNYKIDFAFPELKIGFEPGASEWHATDKRWGDNYVGLSPESVYNEPKIEDVKKDRALYGSGWILIWLNEEFKHNIEDTKEYIQGILEKIKNDRESLKKEKEKCMQDIEELSEGPTVNPTTNPVDSKIEIKIESNGYTVKLIEKKDKYTYNHMILLDKENNEIRYD